MPRPEASGNGLWHATVLEVNGDELTCDLRREGEIDLLAEVSISLWQLEVVNIGDVLVLDTVNRTVKKLDLGTWTQSDIDNIRARAHEWYNQLMRCFE